MIRLSDAALSALLQAAQPLPIADRDAFLRNVAERLTELPADLIGDGSVFRVVREEQRRLMKPPLEMGGRPPSWPSVERA